MVKNLNKKFKDIILLLVLFVVIILIDKIYQEEFTSNCVFSTEDNVVHNESRYCTKNGNVLKNQFMIYQLNRNEDALLTFMYEYSGNKENSVATDNIDDKNFLTLTRDYIDNYKSSKKYNENLKFFDYIYKSFYPTKYEEFK